MASVCRMYTPLPRWVGVSSARFELLGEITRYNNFCAVYFDALQSYFSVCTDTLREICGGHRMAFVTSVDYNSLQYRFQSILFLPGFYSTIFFMACFRCLYLRDHG